MLPLQTALSRTIPHSTRSRTRSLRRFVVFLGSVRMPRENAAPRLPPAVRSPEVGVTEAPSGSGIAIVGIIGAGTMGTGFAHGIWIRDVGVVQNQWGKPEVVYSERGEKMRRQLGIGDGHVTLTDEAGLIVAVAVLEKAQSGMNK